jgi:hypothetical protein
MCTLIVGNQILGPGTLVIAANRDEDPRRPSDPPAPLVGTPHVVGGRDRVAGGTWLAIRDRRAAIAMLNRRDSGAVRSGTMKEAGPDASAPRSRGLLALDVAATPSDPPADARALARAARDRAIAAVTASRYAPFSLAFLSPGTCWLLAHEPGVEREPIVIPYGWHVLTHADLDDPDEPRTAWLVQSLARFTPQSFDEAERGVIERLATHADAAHPAVCIHEGRMVTVSSSVVCLSRGEARYRHLEGRPCERALSDHSPLLSGPLPTSEDS